MSLVAGRAGALDIGAWPLHPRLGFTWQPGEHSFPRLTRGWACPRDLAREGGTLEARSPGRARSAHPSRLVLAPGMPPTPRPRG